NEKWEAQKKMIREQLSDEEMGKLYGKRKIDVDPFFGFLKANLGFTRFSVRGKPKVENELGFALMAVNLRRYAASSRFLCTYLSMISKNMDFTLKSDVKSIFSLFLASYVPASIIVMALLQYIFFYLKFF